MVTLTQGGTGQTASGWARRTNAPDVATKKGRQPSSVKEPQGTRTTSFEDGTQENEAQIRTKAATGDRALPLRTSLNIGGETH